MSHLHSYTALQDFRRARRQAQLEQMLEFLENTPTARRADDDNAADVHTRPAKTREFCEIPLNAIGGSVNRYHDFSRAFLRGQEPRDTSPATFPHVQQEGFPPIEVYQIDDGYIVYDGNHRVAVARQVGAALIEAYITPIHTADCVPADGAPPEEIILNAEYRQFLAQTQLDHARSLPQDFYVTVPGKYRVIAEEIQLRRFTRSADAQETLTRWYDDVCLPFLELVGKYGILRDFPRRTPLDMYVWLVEHHALLRHREKSSVREEIARLPERSSPRPPAKSDPERINVEYRHFLEKTQLATLRPEIDLLVSQSGKYRILEDHIHVHRYFMGLEQKRAIPYYEAVTHWCDLVYLPLIRLIQGEELQEYFAGQTLSDLYLWISEHRSISRQDETDYHDMYLHRQWEHLKPSSYHCLDELLVKVERIDFLARTQLHELRPKADISLSAPGQYRILEKHIDVHRYFMGIDRRREIPYHDAVIHWYDSVYLPVLRVMLEQRMPGDFPDLSASDLYLWITEHQATLERHLGTTVSLDAACHDLKNRFGSGKSAPIISGRQHSLTETTTAAEKQTTVLHRLELAERRKEHLFSNILVPLNGKPQGWRVLEQAVEIARREHAFLTGLHVVSSEHLRYKETTLGVRHQFAQYCRKADIEGEFRIETGDIVQHICEYARQADLLVLHLLHEPNAPTVPRLQAELQGLGHRCARSILALPAATTHVRLQRALLTYDGTKHADEALFAGVYLAGAWNVQLVILTPQLDAAPLTFLEQYLKQHHVHATLLEEQGTFSAMLPNVLKEAQIDFIIHGSADEQAVTTMQRPVLFCR